MEEEDATKYKGILESDSEITENEAFLGTIILLDNSLSDRNNTNIDDNEMDDWKDKPRKNEPISEVWIQSGESFCTKNKLI